MLDEGRKSGINRSFGSPRNKFCLTLRYHSDNSYLLVNGKEFFRLKANNKNVNFPTQFCLENISNGFGATESEEVSLKENLYDFSIDYNAIDKSSILNICKYLMVNNNRKYCLSLLEKCLLDYYVVAFL